MAFPNCDELPTISSAHGPLRPILDSKYMHVTPIPVPLVSASAHLQVRSCMLPGQ